MFSWLAHRIVSLQMARLRDGDLRPVLIMDAPDVRLDFPGESSWAPGARGKAEPRALAAAVRRGRHADPAGRGHRQGLPVAPDDVRPRHRSPAWSRRRERLREPLRDLGPARLGAPGSTRSTRTRRRARRSTPGWRTSQPVADGEPRARARPGSAHAARRSSSESADPRRVRRSGRARPRAQLERELRRSRHGAIAPSPATGQ